MASDVSQCREAIVKGSKSFAFASLFLSKKAKVEAYALYAWCRYVDDAIDETPLAIRPSILSQLNQELTHIYQNKPQVDPVLRAFAAMVRDVNLPEVYPRELLAGMAMDVDGHHYQTVDDLLLYCYRVAGVVGHMMCHILGLSDHRALPFAAHLGIAMQLTNIARDIKTDWQNGRLYLPDEMLAPHNLAALRQQIGSTLPPSAIPELKMVTADLLNLAETFYKSAARGYAALPFRARIAIRAASFIYAEIGNIKAKQGFDPLAERAVVSGMTKLRLAGKAIFLTMLDRQQPWRKSTLPLARYPHDVLPV